MKADKHKQFTPMTHEEVLLLQDELAQRPLFFRIEVTGILLMLGFIMVTVISLTDLGKIRLAILLASLVVTLLFVRQFWANYRSRAALRKDIIHREKRLTRVKLSKKEKRFAPEFRLIYLADRSNAIMVEEDFYEAVNRGQYFEIWRSRYANVCLSEIISSEQGQIASLDQVFSEQVQTRAQQDWYAAQ
ncbi:MAG: hypothetical protein AAF433_12995 [Bacteroidota bacterium]